MKLTLLFTSLFLFLNVNSQCIFPTGATQNGTQTFCVNTPVSSQNVTNVKGDNFVLVNVVQGFTYSFSVGDAFAADSENLNIFDTSNVNIGYASGAMGTSISNWVAPFSGQVKITLSYGVCNASSSTGKTITLSLISVGNTLDNQNAFGTDTWVGHAYNWTGGPPPGGASPVAPVATFPFNPENYVGYYAVPSEPFTEGFGGSYNCFSLSSGGSVRTSIYTETYAVRYKMKSTRPAGCYIATFRGDDGIRLYVDNQLVFDRWVEQSPTNYFNVFIYLDGDADLIYDFYENGGQNEVQFSLAPFNSASNSISLIGSASVCNNVAPGLLDGSTYVYNGGAINPTIAFQWQVSTDNILFTDIVGATATAENYSPPATTTAGTLYYRREVSAAANAASCNFPSNSIAITTDAVAVAITPVAVAGTNATCSQFNANWNAVAGASSYVLDVSNVSNFLTVLPGYNALNVGNVTSYLVTGLTANVAYYYRIRPVFACGVGRFSNTITYGTLNVNKPANPTTSAISCTSFTANWVTQTNATSYELDVSTVNTFATFLPGYNALNVGNVTNYPVTGLPSISPLYLRIRAVSPCGVSTSSNTITISIGTTWDGTAWSSGVPDLTKFAIINGAYDMATLPSFDACSVQVKSPFVLKVDNTKYVNIQNGLTVDSGANVIVENNGSLVQINNSAINTGTVSIKRDANLRLQDYSYWSAPVGTGLAGTFPVQSVSPLTPAGYIFKWGTTTTNANGGEGTWVNTAENMVPAKGYILRAPTGFINTLPGNTLTANFVGVPNNGVYSPTIFRGNDYGGAGLQGMLRTATDDNWNLIGNPYPSAISVNEFLSLPANSNIEGFVKIWTHGTSPISATSPFYQAYSYNYTPSDYITINATGATSGAIGDYRIGAGQGFMVLMNPGVPSSSTVTFNNAMRSATFANASFYRSANATAVVEKHRIWLDLVTPTGSVNRTVVGYVTGATQVEDRLYDAFTDNKASQNFYSLIENKPMVIQGRALPFDVNDKVSIGIQIPTNGTYTIAIATVDGLFAGNEQKIYIEDKVLNTIHDLTASTYQFTATQGITNDRFVLRYTNQTLSNADFDLSENAVTIFASNNEIKINSSSESIKNYTVYNVLGQTLAEKNNVNTNQSAISSILKNNQALIVKVTLENGRTVIKKIIF